MLPIPILTGSRVRAYRYHLARWGALKSTHGGYARAPHYPIPAQDSATRPARHTARIPLQEVRSQAPSPTLSIWSEAGSYQTSDTSVSTARSGTSINSVQKTSLFLTSQPSSPPLLTPPNALHATSAAVGIPVPSPSTNVAFVDESPEFQSSNSRSSSQVSNFASQSAGPSCQIQGRNAPSIGTA